MGVIADVADVMASYGIPEWIWQPIMQLESGGNVSAIADTAKEYSVGLFQINLKAHPEFAGFDLTDPRQNATAIARLWSSRLDFSDVLAMPMEKQAAHVWQYGSRPAWTPAHEIRVTELSRDYFPNNGDPYRSSTEDFMRSFRALFPDDADEIYGPGERPEAAADGSIPYLGVAGVVYRGVAYGLIFIAVLVALVMMAGGDKMIKEVIKP